MTSVRVRVAEFERSAAVGRRLARPRPTARRPRSRSAAAPTSASRRCSTRWSSARGLVRTSRTPGRTRLINFFRGRGPRRRARGGALRFVDLPGFGYAKVSKTERATWRPAIERYLARREPLRWWCCWSTRGACQARSDRRARARAAWIAARGVPVIPVITKTDKLAKHERPLRRPSALRKRLRRRAGAVQRRRPAMGATSCGAGSCARATAGGRFDAPDAATPADRGLASRRCAAADARSRTARRARAARAWSSRRC